MKIYFIISIIVYLINVCVPDKHTYGSRLENYEYTFREIVLIDDNNYKAPKSYDIIFNLYTTFLKTIGYIEFDIDSPSSGSIVMVKGSKKHPVLDMDFVILNYEAKIHINGTSKVKATLIIYGRGTNTPSLISYSEVLEVTRSFIFIYVKNATPAKKMFAQNAIGKRQKGDELIYFQTRNVTNASRFPSRSFEYSGEAYITYAGFSFNSPTAMVMVNTTFISAKEFNAVVYDMNTEHFVANMSIYGIKSKVKPEEFVGLL